MRRHVELPEDREPPVDCLRALRAIDERAEMVYAGNGLWWLGVVREDTPAREEGDALMAVCQRREREGKVARLATYRKARLMQQGFRLLASVGAHNGGTDPLPSACAEALAPPLYSTTKEDDQMTDAQERVSDGTVRREASDAFLRDEVLGYHARDVYRTHKRTSITVNGSKAS